LFLREPLANAHDNENHQEDCTHGQAKAGGSLVPVKKQPDETQDSF
jgi:hypothetical protein